MLPNADWTWPMITEPDLMMMKQVDWSLLRSGWTIPVDLHDRVIADNEGARLRPGDKRSIVLLIGGHPFSATLTCVRRPQGPPHILQVRYDRNQELRQVLDAAFWTSRTRLELERAKLRRELGPGAKIFAEVPPSSAEFVDWRSTGVPFCYQVDLIPCRLRASDRVLPVLAGLGEPHVEAVLQEGSEEQFANWLRAIQSLAQAESTEIARCLQYGRRYVSLARHLLGQLYGQTCQLCGGRPHMPIGDIVSITHHIDPVTVSTDNRVSNLILLCPTHHAMLHTADFTFERANLRFVSPRAGTLEIAVNRHLQCRMS